MRKLAILAFITASMLFGGFATAEAGQKCPGNTSCQSAVAAEFASLRSSLAHGPKLATTPSDCPVVDRLSYTMAANCKTAKAWCRDNGMPGDCTAVCAKCDVQQEFVLGWQRYCNGVGYVSPY